MKNLAKAIISVMKEVRGMEKNSEVGFGNNSYSGTKDSDVKEVFNEIMAKQGLCILPTSIEENTQVDRWTETYNGNAKQKQSVFTKVNTRYLLLHDSGESQEVAGYGHGVDAQDKGAGKATTYALKNCLLYTFLTPVGKIDDTETTHSNDMNVPSTIKTDPIKTKGSKEDIKKPITESDGDMGIEGGFTLAFMMNKYEMSAAQQQKYAKLLDAKNGDSKS